MILFRVIQGLAGGGLQPCSQGVLMDCFPPEKQGTAMTLFGVAAIIAPIVGPTLGGWLCVDYDWRWIFLINVPIGLLSLVAAYFVVEDPDYLKKERAELLRRPLNFDYIGLGLLALVMSCWEIMLSKGQEWDWLGDPFGRVQTLVLVFVLGLGFLIFREMRIARPDHQLPGAQASATSPCPASSCSVAFAVLYGASIALPGMLQSLFGYDALRSGLVMSPSGVSSLAAMVLVGVLMGRGVDARWLVAAGLVVDGRRQLLDGADEPADQPLAGGRAADAADPRPGAAVRADQRGRLQVHPAAPARGGGRAAQPAPHRGGQRRHVDGPDDPGAARAVPPGPPGRAPRPAEPARRRASWTRPGRSSCSGPATRPRRSSWACRRSTTCASSRPRRSPTSTSSGCAPSWRRHSSFWCC